MQEILERSKVDVEPKKSVTFRLYMDDADRFKDVCRKQGTTASKVINVFIKKFSEQYG